MSIQLCPPLMISKEEIDEMVAIVDESLSVALVPMTESAREALLEAKAAALTGHVIEYAGDPVAEIKKSLSSRGGTRRATGRGFASRTAPHRSGAHGGEGCADGRDRAIPRAHQRGDHLQNLCPVQPDLSSEGCRRARMNRSPNVLRGQKEAVLPCSNEQLTGQKTNGE
jgi:hypothetical protein